jgi:hypothetical protein
VLFAFLAVSCAEQDHLHLEINMVNGTWLPDPIYNNIITENSALDSFYTYEFAWGIGFRGSDSILNIDISASKPYISEYINGKFEIAGVTKKSKNEIVLRAYRIIDENIPDARWDFDVVFHFIDENTIWIEAEPYTGSDFDNKALWRRLSGPN